MEITIIHIRDIYDISEKKWDSKFIITNKGLKEIPFRGEYVAEFISSVNRYMSPIVLIKTLYLPVKT